VPAVKALITQELVEKHGLKQEEVAKILGISQSAVSKYTKKVRGQAIILEEMIEIQIPIDNIVTLIVDGASSRTEFLKLFCEICRTIREKGLMCEFCQKTNPTIKMEECTFCDGKYTPKKRR
jgi:predicted transcriptional regulator